jgi:nicotinamide-nucleotide amidase
MSRMWDKEVAPRLRGRSTEAVIVSHTVKTVGIGEGTLDEMVSPLLKSTNPSIGVYAKSDGVHLRITAKASTEEEARALIWPVQDEVERILGPAVWGHDDDTMEQSIGRVLKERGLTLATMESATGGLLSSTITDAPGSSAYFRGGLIAYATEQKIAWGVDAEVIAEHGVISAECAKEMARATRAMLGTDIGVGVTGVAGPDPQEDKPVGTMHIAVDSGDGEPQAISYQFAQGREAAKRRAVTVAFQLLRRVLMASSG